MREVAVRLWDDAETQQYSTSGIHPCFSCPNQMHKASLILVVGSHVSYEVAQSVAIHHRVPCAWNRFQAIRPQLKQRGVPLRLRCALLQSVVAATLLWGLESVNTNREVRRRLTGIHRRMLAACILILRRSNETEVEFYRRRGRIITTMARRHFRCSLGGGLAQIPLLYFIGTCSTTRPTGTPRVSCAGMAKLEMVASIRTTATAESGGSR